MILRGRKQAHSRVTVLMPKAPSNPRVREVLSDIAARRQYWDQLKKSKPDKDGGRLVQIITAEGETVHLKVYPATATGYRPR